MPKKYKHVEILRETLDLPSKIKITYEDGSIEEVDNAYDCNIHLQAFAEQVGLEDIDSLLNDESKVTLLNKKKGYTDGSREEASEDSADEKEENPDKKTEKKKKGLNIKRIGAWFLAILAGGGIAYGAFKLGQSYTSNKTKKFVQIVDTPEYDNWDYEDKLALLIENHDEVIDGLIDMINGNFRNSKELDQCIENITNNYLANVTEISNFINGNMSSPSGNKVIINFGEAFKENPIDFCAVKYFESLRDNVVNNAYDTKNVTETKTSVTNFNKEFVEFVFGGKALSYNMNGTTVYYNFESLSPSAQMTIVTMGMTMLNIEHDFSITIDGVEYNRIVAVTEAYELNKSIYQELVNTQKYTKTK